MTHTAHTAPGPAAPADPRPFLNTAVALAGRTLAAVRAGRLDDPTPCTEYTVGQLSRHLVAALRRIALAANGGDPASQPLVADDFADGDVLKAWEAAARDAAEAWADPAVLERALTLPFGTLPGAAVAVAFTTEFTLHTWDLATATGQRPTWDPELLKVCLAAAPRALPAQPRGGPVPFAAVVDVAPEAPDIDRLVAWSGRTP
ncbi:TIGR03086 family metal-binding protein (plasmid) [Streptomyces sp. CA-294286]|uniref:TIGR03086 family metal-binding protein n=1 Tax=Streptomyces sp. CA-294286 TaxID=3240070 RepID=UPI003D8E7DCB